MIEYLVVDGVVQVDPQRLLSITTELDISPIRKRQEPGAAFV